MSEHVKVMSMRLWGKSAKTEQAQKSAATVSADGIEQIEPRTLTLSGNSIQELAEIKVPTPGATLELSAAIVYRLKGSHSTHKAVALFKFLDAAGKKIEDIPGVGIAAAFKQHFRYLNANSKTLDDTVQEVFKIKLPDDIASVRIALSSLGGEPDEHVYIRIQGRCYSEEAEKERKRQLLLRQPFPPQSSMTPSKSATPQIFPLLAYWMNLRRNALPTS